MKPKVYFTFIGVSLLTGVEKKIWQVSHSRYRANRQPSWLSLRSAPRGLLGQTPHITRKDLAVHGSFLREIGGMASFGNDTRRLLPPLHGADNVVRRLLQGCHGNVACHQPCYTLVT